MALGITIPLPTHPLNVEINCDSADRLLGDRVQQQRPSGIILSFGLSDAAFCRNWTVTSVGWRLRKTRRGSFVAEYIGWMLPPPSLLVIVQLLMPSGSQCLRLATKVRSEHLFTMALFYWLDTQERQRGRRRQRRRRRKGVLMAFCLPESNFRHSIPESSGRRAKVRP